MTLNSKMSGSAMLLVLLAVVILLFIGGGLLSLGFHGRMQTIRASSEIAARSAADAGLTKALFEMNEKLRLKTWNDNSLPQATGEALPNCGATFSYTVTADSNSNYAIESIGDSGRANRRVNSTLRLQTPFEYGILVQEDIILRNGTTIDWYNYDADDGSLKIGTNSTDGGAIIAKTGVTIDGDVIVGADGDPTTIVDSQDEAVITGDVYAASETYEFPPVTVPDNLLTSPSKGIISDSTTITDSGKYDSIGLGNGKIITIDRPVTLYVPGSIILDNSAQIQVVDANTGGGSLTLYLGGNLVSQNGAFINNLTKDAKNVKIYGLDTCQSIVFKTNSLFYGAIYAPNADIQLKNNVEIFGSVVGKSFTQDVNANFHYDASLREATVSDEAVRFVIERWFEE